MVNWNPIISSSTGAPRWSSPVLRVEWSIEPVRFSFSSGSFPTFSLPSIFELGYEAGADAIEIMLTPRLVTQGCSRLRFLEEQFRLPIASIHSVMRLGRTDSNRRHADVIDSARLASRLRNCRTLVVHQSPGHWDNQGVDGKWLDSVQSANDILARNNASVSIENSDLPPGVEPPDEWLAIIRWKALVQEFGLRATFDTSHAAQNGWDLLKFAKSAPREMDNVHLSDSGGRLYANALMNSLLHQHRRPGAGELELERFLARLAQTEFSGLITLEISPLRLPRFWLPAARHALADMIGYCRRSAGDPRQKPVSSSRRRASRLDR